MSARTLSALLSAFCGLLAAAGACAQNQFFGDWPAGTDPKAIGKLVAERFIPTPHMVNTNHGRLSLHYAHVATWTGALQFAQVTKDDDLRRRLVERFDPFMTPAESARIPRMDHVDGAVFLEKRPPSGIWGGLWSLPELADATQIDDWCSERLSATAESCTDMPTLRHSFSHYDLDIHPVVVRLQAASARVADSAAGRFVPFDESDGVGLAAPVRKLVAALQQSGL